MKSAKTKIYRIFVPIFLHSSLTTRGYNGRYRVALATFGSRCQHCWPLVPHEKSYGVFGFGLYVPFFHWDQFLPLPLSQGCIRSPPNSSENCRVCFIGEHEHLIVFVPPGNGVAMPGERKFPVFAKSAELMKVLADAFIFRERDPMRTIVVRSPEYPEIGTQSGKAPLDRPVDDLIGSGILSALLAQLPVAARRTARLLWPASDQQLLRRLVGIPAR